MISITVTQTPNLPIIQVTSAGKGSPAGKENTMLFRELALPWIESGYDTTLPLPYGKKFAPPAGYTGKEATVPTMETLQTWLSGNQRSNAALRLPENLIGIDVDAYKGGLETLARLESELGSLPETVSITSRNDGSGIFLYRNVSRAILPGALGPAVEVIQPHHRYVVLPGSLHPVTGKEYALRGSTSPVEPRKIPRLPRAWVRGLQALKSAPATPVEITRVTDTETMCPWMGRAIDKFYAAVASGEARYDSALRAAYNISMLSQEGHTGAVEALQRLQQAYMLATSERSIAAGGEWHRMTQKLALAPGQCSHKKEVN